MAGVWWYGDLKIWEYLDYNVELNSEFVLA